MLAVGTRMRKYFGVVTVAAIIHYIALNAVRRRYHQGVKMPEESNSRKRSAIEERPRTLLTLHPAVTPIPKGRCPAVTQIVYLKTHKTGSTSLLQVFHRYQKKHPGRGAIAWPVPFYGGYPGSYMSKFHCQENSTNLCGSTKKTETGDPVKYLMGHMRFNKREIEKVVGNGARYFTILRNPESQQESSFNFYYARHQNYPTHIYRIACHGEPYRQIAKKFGARYSEYLEAADKRVLNSSIAYFFRSRNPQAYDLGLDPDKEDSRYILERAAELDSAFDLVLILDHILESLVLLKDQLCLDWDDVVFESAQLGDYTKHVYTQKELDNLHAMNYQDFLLFDYFNKTLWKKVAEYGHERMRRDTEHLSKLLNENIQENSPSNASEQGKLISSLKTAHKVKDDKSRPRLSRKKHIERMETRIHDGHSNKGSSVQDLASYMYDNAGWCTF